ncbi:MAG TPA: thioesterase family protein [Terriglobales bacterium]|nr:thioesterase family protein [Terriglobales bacterium]
MSVTPPNDTPVETQIRVRYAETDQMGVVYYANFFVWFEIGRVEYLRARGLAYRDLEKDDGCYIPVVDAHCRYKSPARYDDLIAIRTWVTRRRGSLLDFAYEIARTADGELLATGETTHVIVDRNFQPRDLPENYRLGAAAADRASR